MARLHKNFHWFQAKTMIEEKLDRFWHGTFGIGNSFWHLGQDKTFLGLIKGKRQLRQNRCEHCKIRGCLHALKHKLHIFCPRLFSSPLGLFVLVSPGGNVEKMMETIKLGKNAPQERTLIFKRLPACFSDGFAFFWPLIVVINFAYCMHSLVFGNFS